MLHADLVTPVTALQRQLACLHLCLSTMTQGEHKAMAARTSTAMQAWWRAKGEAWEC